MRIMDSDMALSPSRDASEGGAGVAEQTREHVHGCPDAFDELVSNRTAAPGTGLAVHGAGLSSSGGSAVGLIRTVEQIDAGDAVDHAVMHLVDHRHPAAFEALDEPRLPERLPAIEPLRHDARAQALELRHVTRAGQTGVAQVVVQIEALVVDPYGSSHQRDVRQLLAVPRDQVQA